MANRKAVKAPATKPQDSDSDGVPDLISDSDDSSDDEPRPRRAPPVSTKAPPAPPVAPVPAAAKPKPTPVPPPADEVDSSDEESVAGDETEADKKKKKKKPKKKKPKKKAAAADADGSSSPATSSSSAQNGVVPPPVVKAAVEPVPAAPVKVVDPEEEKRKLVEAAFRTKWQSVIAAVADVRKKLNLKNNKTSSLNTLEDLSFSWAAQKFEYDVIEERTQEERRYQEACADVIAEGTTEEVFDDSDLYEDDGQALPTAEEVDAAAAEETLPDSAQVYPVELSIAVKKWLERQDERYRVMFEGRIKQLAAGQRSYALSKRLKHCSFPVYETKLDPGQRILWTQVDREDSDAAASVTTLIVWFAAKHHRVPHLLRLIEHSCGRTIKQVEGRKTGGITDSAQLSSVASRYVVTKEGMKALLHLPEDAVMLDPQGNIPLKIFPVPDLSQLSVENWRAPLRLNKLEQSVRKQQGAVLLLGRSGTGKTLCLMDRMHHDRLSLQSDYNRAIAASGGADFASATRRPSQLFVARSLQLCELVRRYQQHNANDDLAANVECLYMRMRHFLADVEGKLISAATAESATGEERRFYQTHRESDCVDFGRFARDIFPVISATAALSKVKVSSGGAGGATTHTPLDALVVWTQIRSFLKGSVDAVLQGGSLSLDTYLTFSEGRCRLQEEQRRQAYALYRLYASHLKEHGLWDDMDRVQSVLSRAFRLARRRNSTSSSSGASVSPTRESQENLSEVLAHTAWDVYFDKVYVDEVQDYTQAEIAVFLLAVGFRTDCIFLAGDPAQSVVEGVDFRFEEVRSLVFQLSSGTARLDRAIKLLTNYRSHSGVLSCAAAIIDKLLLMFPGSANVLSKDEGLFTGPRPNFCNVKDPLEILQVLGKGVAVLAPDNSAWLRRSATSAAQNTAAVVDTMLESHMELLDVEEGAGTGVDPSSSTSASSFSALPALSASAAAEEGILHLGNTVMGIRAAKGLEFSDVVVLDFFSSVSKDDAKAWKVLFADSTDVAVQDQQFKYPQLEPQLKMLYTAITRSMNRLLFVESVQSPAGDAFFRWLKNNNLADKFDLSAARSLGEARYITIDEWKVRGIQFAGQVDPRVSKDAIETNAGLLDQAIRCFTNANDVALKATATVQKRLGSVMLSLLSTRSGAGSVSADSTEVENCRAAILAGLEKGLFEDVYLLCSSLAETLEPAHLKTLFEKEVCSIFKNNEADVVGF